MSQNTPNTNQEKKRKEKATYKHTPSPGIRAVSRGRRVDGAEVIVEVVGGGISQ